MLRLGLEKIQLLSVIGSGYVAVKPEGLGHATIKVVQKIALFLGERHQVDHESSDYLSTAWHD